MTNLRTSQRPPLVPRLKNQGYDRQQIDRRRSWLEARTNASLEHVGQMSVDTESWRGNIENPIGVAQVPLGVAGPLAVRGEHARGTFYVPMATTEGALVRSYERGMAMITRAGGADVRIYRDENRVSPAFTFPDVAAAHAFAGQVASHADALRAAAEATTSHGTLLGMECLPIGRRLILDLRFGTGDAHGMNMIVKAADAVCRWLREHLDAPPYDIFSGYEGEKRASGAVMAGGKGKTVTAGVHLSATLVKTMLHTTAQRLEAVWHSTILGHVRAATVGFNAHYANGLTALFIATGQDVANVANAAVGISDLALADDGGVDATVTLTSLTVATVGGGTALGTAAECLDMLGCLGSGQAPKFAEIAAAMMLAGELSMTGAIASGEFVNAHETYGRNRPEGAS